MRFDGGWIKLWRNLDDHWIGRDGYALAIFAKILWWANYKDSKIIQGRDTPTTVRRGQLLTSVRQLSEILQFDRKTVTGRLKALETDGTKVCLSTGLLHSYA